MFEKLRKSSGRLLSALYAALLVNTVAAAVISASPAESNNNAASAGGPSRALMQDKWWDSNDANGHTVYFYDKEFRNAAISAHVWNRTEGSPDTPYYDWDEREQLKFTGKQVVIDGTAYPLYEYDFWWYGNTPTHILFRVEKNGDVAATNTPDLKFHDGALYCINDLADSEGDIAFDIATAEDVDPKYHHTVYFAQDQTYYWNAQDTYVHVWGTGGDLRPWAYNESMTACVTPNPNPAYQGTPKYVWYETAYVYVFEYDFWYFGGEPTNLLFHNLSPYYGNPFTGDLEFVEGALYGYKGNGVVTQAIPDPEIVPEIPTLTGTFYVADTDGWIAPGSEIRQWYNYNLMIGMNDQDWPSVGYTHDTSFKDKYVEINGRWYPLYKFDLTSGNGKVWNIRLSNESWTKRASAYMPWQDGGVYYFSGEKVASEVRNIADCKISDGLPEEDPSAHRKVTFYLSLGANQIMETDLWEQPYCRPIKRPLDDYNVSRFASPYGRLNEEYVRDADGNMVYDDNGYPKMEYKFVEPLEGLLPKYEDRTADDAMEQVAPGVWKFTVDDIAGYDDVLFYYYTLEDPELVVHPASRSRYFNPTEWDGYVFDIGTDCVHQSYLTVDEYESLRQKDLKEATTLYLAGSSAMSGLTGQDDPIKSVPVEADHGCFFYEFDVTDESAASFKISTMDVAGIVGGKNLADHYSFQRGWATFNLGIVGCHMDPSAENYREWYDAHVMRPQEGASREIYFKTNESLGYNRYTQYAWRVAVGESGVQQAGKYWLVVDFLDEDQSVTLLDFDPHPHAVARPTGFRNVDVPADKAKELHGGEYLAASEHNGKALFDKVNIVSGEIDIEGTGQHLIEDEGFEVAYTLWLDGEKALVRDGKPEKIRMDYMNIGDDASLAVRARFHDTKTGRYFSTRFSDGTIEANPELFPAPTATVVDKALSGYKGESTPWTIAAVALVSYEPGDTPLKSYPDYKGHSAQVGGEAVDGATYPLLRHDHPYVGYGWGSYLGASGDIPWVPAEDDGEFTDANNWPAYILREGKMSVLADNLDEVAALPYKGDCVYNLDVAAVYPILARKHDFDLSIDGEDVAAYAANRLPGETLPADLSGYAMSRVTSSTPVEVKIENTVVSGVESVAADHPREDAHREVYDLSGKPVKGTPAPGVYIIREGDKVTKTVIR